MSMAASFKRIGLDASNDRALFLLSAENPAEVSEIRISPGSTYFVSLIACDSRDRSTAEIAGVARMLLDAGCVYFCCWGPGCERVHDIVDEEYALGGLSVHDDESTIMTTWHDKESLDEAVWFALNAAFPDDRFIDDSRSVVGVCIGRSGWATEIAAAFADPRALQARVVGDDHNAA
jgi:hypothetical protein